ncbi:MAG: metal ABC transporter permease [Pseudomonadota bacterium]
MDLTGLDLSPLWDPMFRIPLATGLVAAALLPLLGLWLRLREEWLAALGIGHVGAATVLAGGALGLGVLPAGLGGAAVAVALKAALGRAGNSGWGVLILGGWAASLLVGANSDLGEAASHALVEGQLYFAGPAHLAGLAGIAGVAALTLPWLGPRLLRSRLFPEADGANGRPAWRWHRGFDTLVAAALTLAAASLGLMAAFALAFLPAWVAFRRAHSWRRALFLAPLIGVAAYVAAFVAAIALDQPFAPVLVVVLLLVAAAGLRSRG